VVSFLQKERIAKDDAIGRTDFEEESILHFIEYFAEHPEILS
jgi:hypothetical protein